MPAYIQLSFTVTTPETSQILIALLGEAGYTFEETDAGLKAFIQEDLFNENLISEISGKFRLDFTKETIPGKNWNAEWESNFNPVIIGEFVGIRANFHQPLNSVKHEIIITPKMSFGTGHHATTSLMIQQMEEIDFINKKVVDFGTGTGILSILAEKSGAAKILAIDNDEWSITNAAENLQQNNCNKVELRKDNCLRAGQSFDIILANINRNVLLDNFSSLVRHLVPGGILLISGIINEDEESILAEAHRFSMNTCKKTQDSNWLCISFIH